MCERAKDEIFEKRLTQIEGLFQHRFDTLEEKLPKRPTTRDRLLHYGEKLLVPLLVGILAYLAAWSATRLEEQGHDKDTQFRYVEMLLAAATSSGSEKFDRVIAVLEVLDNDLFARLAPVLIKSSRSEEERTKLWTMTNARSDREIRAGNVAGDILTVARLMEKLIDNGKYEQALGYLGTLDNKNRSGIGYYVYPKVAFAFERVGNSESACETLRNLRVAMQNDAENKYGYLASDIPLKGIQRDLETSLAQVKNPSVKTAMSELLKWMGTTRKKLGLKAPRTGSDELTIARYIEALVQKGLYADAVDWYDDLQKAHFSGVGYKAYPEIILAYDQLGQQENALMALNALKKRLDGDASRGRGYLAPGRAPRRFLLRKFNTYLPNMKDESVIEGVTQILEVLN